jgi:hypothetical protein
VIRKLTLAVGFGAGYVLGAKAGKERYSQIQAKFNELMGKPAVQDFTSNVTSTASAAADKAKSTVNEKVEAVSDKVGSSSDSGSGASTSPAPVDEVVVVDLGSTSPTVPPVTPPVTPKPGPGPVLGASASRTAPDVL